MTEDLQLIIMAGGKGTRLNSLTNNIPKPMVTVAGKPVLEHQLNFFCKCGFKNVTVSIGHLGQVIKNYFQDGAAFGLNIKYIEETEPLGTVGALRFSESSPDLLLVVNGDIIFDFDLKRMLDYHKTKNADITLFTHPNSHPQDSAIIETDFNGRVINWLNKEEPRKNIPNRVNAGIHLIRRAVLDFNSVTWQKTKVDLDRDILKPKISTAKIFAYDSPEYVKDMGTPERYFQVEADFKAEIIASKNLNKKQKAIFLDRDGTLNRHIGFLNNAAQMELLDGVGTAVKLINQSSYLALVVSNQPVIARGECTFEEMQNIHNRLEMLLGMEGAYLDGITFCPHHHDKGFTGEVADLKIDCDCRKPKPGMLLKMAEKFNIDLKNSFMIGDSKIDVEAGIAAGCKSIYIGEENISNCYNAKNLLDAVKFILQKS